MAPTHNKLVLVANEAVYFGIWKKKLVVTVTWRGPHPKYWILDLAYLQGKKTMAAMHIPLKFNSSTAIPTAPDLSLYFFSLEHAGTLATNEARAKPGWLENLCFLEFPTTIKPRHKTARLSCKSVSFGIAESV